MRVLHPLVPGAASYWAISPEDVFRQHERQKQLEHQEHIANFDHGSFCPLGFATTGAAGTLYDRFVKRLAALLADDDPTHYSTTMA